MDPLQHPRRLTDDSLANILNLAARQRRRSQATLPPTPDAVQPGPDLFQTLERVGLSRARAGSLAKLAATA